MSRPYSDLVVKKALYLMRRGHSDAEIGRRLVVSSCAVRKWRIKAGVPRNAAGRKKVRQAVMRKVRKLRYSKTRARLARAGWPHDLPLRCVSLVYKLCLKGPLDATHWGGWRHSTQGFRDAAAALVKAGLVYEMRRPSAGPIYHPTAFALESYPLTRKSADHLFCNEA